MIPTSLADLARAAGAQARRCRDGLIVTGDVVHDSRSVRPGDLFVAIRGDSHDGHDFTARALTAGAVAVLVDSSDVADQLDGPALVVPDTVAALGAIAAHTLRRLPGLQVVAVTGSSGKTTTKDLMASVLTEFGETVAARGSFNNDVGLPMTALAVTESTRYRVLEMGARARGDIARLCEIANPDVGVVLNVGSAHEGQFGSRAVTAAAKGELVAAMDRTGVAVLNADDPLVAAMAAATPASVITFGETAQADVRLSEITLDELARPTLRITHREHAVSTALRVSGQHQAANAGAVIAAGLGLGLGLDDLGAALSRAEVGSRWRMEIVHTVAGPIVINDSYNANPESMAAALRALTSMARGRRSWAVLGQMRELGDRAEVAHEAVGALAAQLGVDEIVAIGPGTRPIAAGAAAVLAAGGPAAGGPANAGLKTQPESLRQGSPRPAGVTNRHARWVPDVRAALAMIAEQIRPRDVVLVKASRAVALEQLAAGLIAAQGGSQESAINL